MFIPDSLIMSIFLFSPLLQIIDLTRQTNPSDVELTFYIVEEGTKLLSGDAKMVLDELTLQEMTLYLDEPVNSPPIGTAGSFLVRNLFTISQNSVKYGLETSLLFFSPLTLYF